MTSGTTSYTGYRQIIINLLLGIGQIQTNKPVEKQLKTVFSHTPFKQNTEITWVNGSPSYLQINYSIKPELDNIKICFDAFGNAEYPLKANFYSGRYHKITEILFDFSYDKGGVYLLFKESGDEEPTKTLLRQSPPFEIASQKPVIFYDQLLYFVSYYVNLAYQDNAS